MDVVYQREACVSPEHNEIGQMQFIILDALSWHLGALFFVPRTILSRSPSLLLSFLISPFQPSLPSLTPFLYSPV